MKKNDQERQAIRAAVIPAAGLGTRFLPASLAVPKELCPLLDRPVLHWLVQEAVEAGVEKVVLVVSPDKKDAVERYFRPHPDLRRRLEQAGGEAYARAVREVERLASRVEIAVQEEQRGLGHAVLCGAFAVGEQPFFVLLGDAPVLAPRSWCVQLREVREAVGGGSVIALREVPVAEVSRYGIAEPTSEAVPGFSQSVRLKGLVEKPSPDEAPSRWAVSGRYLLEPKVFELLEALPPGLGGEIQLTDALARLCRESTVYGRICEGRRFDVGNPRGYVEAVTAFAASDPRCPPVPR